MSNFLAQLLQSSSRIQSLLIGIMLACVANGALLILLPLKLQSDGTSASIIGWIMAGYSIGFMFGSLWGGRIIQRVGHNRSYAASAGIIVIAANLHSLVDTIYFSFVLRLMVGASIAMIYLNLESWLNATSERQSRGFIFALYQFFIALGFLLAPFIAYLFSYSDLRSYGMVSILVALSMIPIVLTRFPSPQIEEAGEHLSIIEMLRDTPSGAVMSLFSGLAIAALLNLSSLFAKWLEFSPSQASILLAATSGSSLIFQLPVGKLADRLDERTIMFGLCLLSLVTSVLIILSIWWQLSWLLITFGMAVLGGCIFCFYPLSVKFIFNQMDSHKVVPAMSTLLLINGMGLILGPIIASYFIQWLEPIGLIYYLFGLMVIGSIFMLVRVILASDRDHDEESIPYVISYDMLNPTKSNLDPRSEFYVTKIRNKTIRSLASSIGISPAKSHRLITEHMQYLQGFSPEEIIAALVMLKPRLAKPIIRAMLLIYPDKTIDFVHALGDLISMRKNLINNLLKAGLSHKADDQTSVEINQLFDYYTSLDETSSTDVDHDSPSNPAINSDKPQSSSD